ncbi:MAG: hypothetical protein WKF77_04080 [Planctomycetaceae bacterium]
MQHTNISITSFGVILVVFMLIMIGVGALKLLSLLVNALTGRGKPQPSAKVGAWSGVVTALVVTAAMFVGLIAFAMLFYAPIASSQHTITMNSQDHERMLESDKMARARELAGLELVAAVEEEQAKKTVDVLAEVAEDARVKAVDDPLVTTKDTKVDPAAEQAAFIEASKAELRQLVSKIGQYVSSSLEKVGDKKGTTVFGQAAKSDNGDVVVIQPSDEMVQQILGPAGQDLLKSFNSALPGRIRQTYALIPLTPPMGSTVPVNPLLAAGGLESIANSIVSFVERADLPAAVAGTEVESDALPAQAGDQLTVEPEIPATPRWMKETDGRRIVVHTKPILEGDDKEAPLTVAINEALAKHVENVTATMNSTLHNQAKFVRMELPQVKAGEYVVDTFERHETFETETDGPQEFLVRYALLEFPEAVDQFAVRLIRQSIQQDRIMGLGIVVGLAWLSVCSAGFGIRQWRKGTRLRRIAAAPLFAVITLPALLVAVGMVFAMSKGVVLHRPWNSQPVSIDLEHM